MENTCPNSDTRSNFFHQQKNMCKQKHQFVSPSWSFAPRAPTLGCIALLDLANAGLEGELTRRLRGLVLGAALPPLRAYIKMRVEIKYHFRRKKNCYEHFQLRHMQKQNKKQETRNKTITFSWSACFSTASCSWAFSVSSLSTSFDSSSYSSTGTTSSDMAEETLKFGE